MMSWWSSKNNNNKAIITYLCQANISTTNQQISLFKCNYFVQSWQESLVSLWEPQKSRWLFFSSSFCSTYQVPKQRQPATRWAWGMGHLTLGSLLKSAKIRHKIILLWQRYISCDIYRQRWRSRRSRRCGWEWLWCCHGLLTLGCCPTLLLRPACIYAIAKVKLFWIWIFRNYLQRTSSVHSG